MSGNSCAGGAVTRRRARKTLASTAIATTLSSMAAPALSCAPQRPIITRGVQSGDVSTDSGMVWARADRPARMLIEATFRARSMPVPGHPRSPRVIFQEAASDAQGANLAPCFGLQFFGQIAIDGTTEVLTVNLRNVDDQVLWSTRIEPRSVQSARRFFRPLPG